MREGHRDRLVQAGPNHPSVKQYLAVKRNRTGVDGAVVLQGVWALRRALDASVRIETVLVVDDALRSDGWEAVVEARARGAQVHSVSERVMARLDDRDGPGGLVAIARLRRRNLDDIALDAKARVVVADGFELAGNLGTLIRCADGAGAAAVLVTDGRIRVTHPLVVKASMGTIFSMPVIETHRVHAARWLRANGFAIVAADPVATLHYRDAPYADRVAVVLGNERNGLDGPWREAADIHVAIPMRGVADSLNVAHAAALVLYEALAQHDGHRVRQHDGQ